MGTEWDIECLDCRERLTFECCKDTDALRAICFHAPLIASLAPLLGPIYELQLRFGYRHEVDVQWFVKHGAHRLVPVGDGHYYDDQCGASFACATCVTCEKNRHTLQCRLVRGHEGAHSHIRA